MGDFAFYGEEIMRLRAAERFVLARIERYRESRREETGEDPVEHCKSRVKTGESMRAKLRARGYPEDCASALKNVTDAVGVRVVCDFIDDVYAVADFIRAQADWRVVKEKDYIANPKPNGYRSYHMVVRLLGGACGGLFVEIQLRTIAADCWASLEHQMKYKHSIRHPKLMEGELKRFADEIVSTDYSLLTIRELMNEEF